MHALKIMVIEPPIKNWRMRGIDGWRLLNGLGGMMDDLAMLDV